MLGTTNNKKAVHLDKPLEIDITHIMQLCCSVCNADFTVATLPEPHLQSRKAYGVSRLFDCPL
jgi:hypothetical protein